jgi:predicted nucleic acid-binding protein
VIVADTSAMLALIDGRDRHHAVMREIYRSDPRGWVLPWAILGELDYMLTRELGRKVAATFLSDLADGGFVVEHGMPGDLRRARDLDRRHAALGMGLVDAVVMAVAERLEAEAIATLDQRHFGAVELKGRQRLLPRDLVR